jgi:hypothetical protein
MCELPFPAASPGSITYHFNRIIIFSAPSNIYRRDERREKSCLRELSQGCPNFGGLRWEQAAASLPNHTGLIGAEEVTVESWEAVYAVK